MSLTQGTRRALLRRGKNYGNKVLGYGPVAYWIQGEKTGLVAVDQVNSPAQDGTYTGVTLGQPGIGDGNTCPLFDGTNDYNNIYTAALVAAFNGAEGTVAIWAKVSGVGVWTDGSLRIMVRLWAAVSDYLELARSGVNNTLNAFYKAGGVSRQVQPAGLAYTDFFHFAMTWSKSAAAGSGELIAYLNGVQNGATVNALGVWAGALIDTRTNIGAGITTPVAVWDGTLAHCALWDRPLAPAEIADLAAL